jgi:hypothetical protein
LLELIMVDIIRWHTCRTILMMMQCTWWWDDDCIDHSSDDKKGKSFRVPLGETLSSTRL